MQFRLRYGAHDIELAPGEFVIGRGEECQLALDDALVSRRHVALRVSGSSLVLIDLGSRNGVTVNGERVRGEQVLNDGDSIGIGKHQLVVQAGRSDTVRRRLSTQTLQAVRLSDLEPALDRVQLGGNSSHPPASPTYSKLLTLGILADKALTLGRVAEAERLLEVPLKELSRDVGDGKPVPAKVLERSASCSVRLAAALTKPEWIHFVFELYGAANQLIPASVVEELHGAVRKVRGLSVVSLDNYLASIRDGVDAPADRFALQRIEGLRQIITA